MHPKTIAPHIKTLNENSGRELIVNTLTSNKDNLTHIQVHKHHKNPQTILKNSKKQSRITPK